MESAVRRWSFRLHPGFRGIGTTQCASFRAGRGVLLCYRRLDGCLGGVALFGHYSTVRNETHHRGHYWSRVVEPQDASKRKMGRPRLCGSWPEPSSIGGGYAGCDAACVSDRHMVVQQSEWAIAARSSSDVKRRRSHAGEPPREIHTAAQQPNGADAPNRLVPFCRQARGSFGPLAC